MREGEPAEVVVLGGAGRQVDLTGSESEADLLGEGQGHGPLVGAVPLHVLELRPDRRLARGVVDDSHTGQHGSGERPVRAADDPALVVLDGLERGGGAEGAAVTRMASSARSSGAVVGAAALRQAG